MIERGVIYVEPETARILRLLKAHLKDGAIGKVTLASIVRNALYSWMNSQGLEYHPAHGDCAEAIVTVIRDAPTPGV